MGAAETDDLFPEVRNPEGTQIINERCTIRTKDGHRVVLVSQILWFSLAALLAILILWRLGKWYEQHTLERQRKNRSQEREDAVALPPRKVIFSLAVLMVLLFSKYFYLASLTSYYTFYLIAKFHVST